MCQQLLDQRYGAGVIIAVGDALVQRDAQRDHLVNIRITVLVVLGLHVLFTYHDEAGVGAPVYQVVVAAGESDGAQIGEEYSGVVGVGADEEFRLDLNGEWDDV